MLDEQAIRESQEVERLADDRLSRRIDSVPPEAHRGCVPRCNHVLDRDAHVRVAVNRLHDVSESVCASNLDVVEPLVVDVILSDG